MVNWYDPPNPPAVGEIAEIEMGIENLGTVWDAVRRPARIEQPDLHETGVIRTNLAKMGIGKKLLIVSRTSPTTLQSKILDISVLLPSASSL